MEARVITETEAEEINNTGERLLKLLRDEWRVEPFIGTFAIVDLFMNIAHGSGMGHEERLAFFTSCSLEFEETVKRQTFGAMAGEEQADA